MSGVRCNIFFFLKQSWELVGERSVVNGVYPVKFFKIYDMSDFNGKLDGVALLIADPPLLKLHQ